MHSDSKSSSQNSTSPHVLGTFDSYRHFQHPIKLLGAHDMPENLKLTVIIAFKDQGAFPGSRVSEINEDGTEHSAIEAWRH